MFKYNCSCCQEEFEKLDFTLYRHITECAKKHLFSSHRELSSIRDEFLQYQIKTQHQIQNIQKTYNDTHVKIKSSYEDMMNTIRKNSQNNLIQEQLASLKIIQQNKYLTDINKIKKEYEDTIHSLKIDYEKKIETLNTKHETMRFDREQKIKDLFVENKNLEKELSHLSSLNNQLKKTNLELESEYMNHKQTITDTINNKNIFIRELLDKQKKTITELDTQNEIYNRKLQEISQLKEQYEKDKQHYIEEISKKIDLFKHTMKEECQLQIKLSNEKDEEIIKLQKEVNYLKDKQFEFSKLQDQYQSTQTKLQEWIHKYNDLEKTMNKSVPRQRQTKIKK